MNRKIPKVVIIGRPNVGKSTLFNLLVKRKMAIVDRKSEVTRDVLSGEVSINEGTFEIVDTGGLNLYSKDTLLSKIKEKAIYFIERADLVLFLVNAEEGLNPLDEEIAEIIRKHKKKYLLVATKIDTKEGKRNIFDFYSLGLSEPIPISSVHSINIDGLKKKIIQMINISKIKEKEKGMRLGIIGTPNTGKSTLINRILNEDRLIVHETPGTTRDTVEIPFEWEKKNFVLFDTAGIRRKSHVKEGLEWIGIKRAEWVIKNSDIICLLIDASRPLIREDLSLARKVEKYAKGVIIAINKIDLIQKKKRKQLVKFVKESLNFLDFSPIIFLSAKTGENVLKILVESIKIYTNLYRRIKLKELNSFLKELLIKRPPLHSTTIYEIIPEGGYIQNLELITNNPYGIKENFLKFLKKEINKHFNFEGVNIKIRVKRK